MEQILGLLKIRVVRGVNLPSRDVNGGDPYVVVMMGDQKLKTGVRANTLNPEWNEDLTLSIDDPTKPIKLEVYDKDRFSKDDKMGDAEFSVQPLLEASKRDLHDIPNGIPIRRVTQVTEHCLASDSCIMLSNGKLVQDMILRLRNAESGEVELQLQWVNLSGGRSC